MVWIDPTPLGFTLAQLVTRAKTDAGITLSGSRVVVHIQVTEEAVKDLVRIVGEMKEEFKAQAEPMDEAETVQNVAFSKGGWQSGKPKRSLRLGVAYGSR